MPIDENILEATILHLIKEITANSIQRQKLRNLHICAQQIKLIKIPDPIPEDLQKTKLIMPIDNELGVIITDKRREQIYNKLLLDVAEL